MSDIIGRHLGPSLKEDRSVHDLVYKCPEHCVGRIVLQQRYLRDSTVMLRGYVTFRATCGFYALTSTPVHSREVREV